MGWPADVTAPQPMPAVPACCLRGTHPDSPCAVCAMTGVSLRHMHCLRPRVWGGVEIGHEGSIMKGLPVPQMGVMRSAKRCLP